METSGEIKVFKFGGASVRNADAVRNLHKIVKQHISEKLIVVISAMGKTTNSLESVLNYWHNAEGNLASQELDVIREFHLAICQDLFASEIPAPLLQEIDFLIDQGKELIGTQEGNYNKTYDHLVSIGELLSTQIVCSFLNKQGLQSQWLDARDVILTDDRHRDARVLWEPTEDHIKRKVRDQGVYITQGFIASSRNGNTTTLGREGSDYSAAVFAYCLNARELTIWKDVDGILNGDPKVFDRPVLIENMSYDDAIELAYFGATVIHPRTIQPLQKRNILLHVKSFIDMSKMGSTISSLPQMKPEVPCFIRKVNQVFIRLQTRDLAFMAEEQLSKAYQLFDKYLASVNFSVHSAVSSGFVITEDQRMLPALAKELDQFFNVEMEKGLHLYTVRHFSDSSIKELENRGEVVYSQSTKMTAQLVIQPIV